MTDVHLTEDILGATISVSERNGHVEEVSYLPMAQARKINRIAQDMEDKMVELRRERAMEETRARATNVTVTNELGNLANNQPQQPAAGDPLLALKALKGMLEAGLITDEEYATKKAQILRRM